MLPKCYGLFMFFLNKRKDYVNVQDLWRKNLRWKTKFVQVGFFLYLCKKVISLLYLTLLKII